MFKPLIFCFLLLVFLEGSSTFDSPAGPCQNNGTPLNSTFCLCPGFVDGQFCENLKCQRWSILDKNRCSCAPGWYDKYCAIRGCRPANEDNLDLSKRSFIIVFNTKTSMAKQMVALRNRFVDLKNSITKNFQTGVEDNWIANYIFYGFVQSGTNFTVQQINTDSSDEFIKFLYNVELFDGDAEQPVLTALRTTQQTFPNMKSHAIVLVFTDSPASDAAPWSHRFTDKTREQDCLQISLLWRSKVSFFLSLRSGINPSLDSVDVYRRLSLTIHGDTFFTKNETETNEILQNVISTYYYPENIAVGYGVTGNNIIDVIRDNENDMVFVIISSDYSSNFSLAPNLINGKFYSQGSSYKLYTFTNDRLNIIATTNDKYNFRVFIQSKNTIHIDYNDDMVTDVGNGMAFIGVGKFATMKLFGFDTSKLMNTSYRVLSSDNQLIRDNFYSFLRPQLDCTYEYSFKLWDTTNCPPGPITQWHTLYYYGSVRQRVTTGYCVLSDHNNDKPSAIEKIETPEIQSMSDVITPDMTCDKINLEAVNDPRLDSPKQFIFILEQHPGNNATYQVLAKEIGEIVDFTKKNSNYDPKTYRNEYTLIIHCNKESHVLLSTYDPDLFVQKFPKLVDSIGFVDNLDNTMGLYSIVQAQKLNIRPTSQVYYFTNQAVKNVQNISRTWDNVNRDIEFNFFTIADGITTEIFALPWQLELVQKMSNGRIIPLGNSETSIKNIFGDISGMNALTTDFENYDCVTAPFEVEAFVENGAVSTNIQIVGTGIKDISVSDKTGVSFGIDKYTSFVNPNFASLIIKDFTTPLNLTPGTWKIRASTTRGGCQVTVRQQSKIGVIIGFAGSQTNDFVDSQIPSQRSDQNQSIFVPIRVFQPSGAANKIEPTSVIIENVNRKRYDMPQLFLNSSVLKKDGNTCSYAYSTPRIPMPQSELSFWTVTGSVNGDIAFVRRFYYYQHFPRDPSVCHGGQVDQYGQCVCPPNYTGEYCWERLCVQGATFSYGMCCCPSGYYGDFCEIELFMNTTVSTSPNPVTTTTVQSTTKTSTPQNNNQIMNLFIVLFVALKLF